MSAREQLHNDQEVIRKIVSLAEQCDVLSEFSNVELMSVARYLKVQKFIISDAIVREGEIADWIGFIVEGAIEVVKESTKANKNVTIASEYKSRLVGELAILDGGMRSATCYARKPTVVLVMSVDSFNLLAERYTTFALRLTRAIAKHVSQRLRLASGQIVDLV
jgi:CRP/FNR family transcriptional regulator, cyclic AMP receptor protein